MAKAKTKGKATVKEKPKTKFGIKKPDDTPKKSHKKPTGKPPKRIKMLMSLAGPRKAYQMGQSYDVPHDIPVNTARGWVACGVAEEDKSEDGPPETK